MANERESHGSSSQSDKFKQAARELGCDEDESAWDERLKKVAKPKPVEKRDAP
jgi:hypothetical protein